VVLKFFSKTINSGFDDVSIPWNTRYEENGEYIITITISYTTGNTKDVVITVTVANEGAVWQSPGFELIPLLLSLFVIAPVFALRRKH
jgi:hypothetical protein